VPKAPRTSHRDNSRFSGLPAFCQPPVLLAVILAALGLALIMALAQVPVHAGLQAMLNHLALLMLLVTWISVLALALLCVLGRSGLLQRRRWLPWPPAWSVLGVILLATAAVTWAAKAWFAPVWLGASPPIFVLRALGIAAIAGGAALWIWQRHIHALAALREAEQAELSTLRAQLNPHFLFNSLNGIAALIPVRAAEAETAVLRLSRLLRTALLDSPWHPLAQELHLAHDYLALQQLRLAERLTVKWEIDALSAELQDAVLVPRLALQVLLENAIRHGVEPSLSPVTVVITAQVTRRADTQHLRLCVRNPVPASTTPASGHGIGLDNLRRQLRLLHGDRAALVIDGPGGPANGPEPGDFRACLRLPLALKAHPLPTPAVKEA